MTHSVQAQLICDFQLHNVWKTALNGLGYLQGSRGSRTPYLFENAKSERHALPYWSHWVCTSTASCATSFVRPMYASGLGCVLIKAAIAEHFTQDGLDCSRDNSGIAAMAG